LYIPAFALAAAGCFTPEGSAVLPELTATATNLDSGDSPVTTGMPPDNSSGELADTTSDASTPTGCDHGECVQPTGSTGTTGATTGTSGALDTTADPSTGSGGSTTCDADCEPAHCGDGEVDPGEACDDGNQADDDGCSSTCQRSRRVFVTAETYAGDLGGVAGADDRCQTSADQAGLSGAFKAWLSSTDESPWARFDIEYTGAYVRTDGQLVAAGGWPDLTSGALASPIACDQFGAEVLVSPYVWTATGTDGSPLDLDCLAWSTAQPANYGIAGSSLATDGTWTDADLLPCGALLRLYCIEDP